MKPRTIAIVGAGIMGRVLAWQLLRTAANQNHTIDITLYDKDPVNSGSAAAYTAAGMLSPYCEVESAENLVFEMGKHSLSLWPQLNQSLGNNIGFSQDGSLIIAHANDRADYQRFLHQLNHKLSSQSHHGINQLNHHQLAQKSPPLAENFNEATYIPDEASVDSQLFMMSIAAYLKSNKVNWRHNCKVDSIAQTHNSAWVKCPQTSEQYDQVIDCRGLSAKEDLKNLRGVRGEVIWLQAPEVDIKHLVRLMHPRYRLYLVPRQHNIYLIGATQLESEDSSAITVRSALELLSAAYSLHPGFAEARLIKTDSNCRPALRDNLPKIECQNRCMSINGLFRHGYLLSPVLAEIATHHILQTGISTVFDADVLH